MLKLINIKKTLFIFLLSLSFSYSQGVKLTPESIKEGFKKLDIEAFGFATTIPRSYSLEQYVPPVEDQVGGTCVGFSTLYYALSTMYNIEYNYTSYQDKFAHAFDPYFIYSIINNYTDDACEEGLYLHEAVEKINTIGAKKRWISPITKCNTNWSSSELSRTKKYTYPLRIDDFFAAEPYEIEGIKSAVYDGHPVTALFGLTDSFNSGQGFYGGGVKKGLWAPSKNEEISGYHAMTVIGYDDYTYGGAFKLVNSWGEDYGDDGFIWITYDAFEEVCVEVYAYSVDFQKNIDYSYDEFRRYSTDKGIYEGEYIGDDLNGYGTWYSKQSSTYYFGFLKNGTWDGFHIELSPDEFKYGNYTDGYFNEYGFADDEFVKKEAQLKEYFELFSGSGIKLEKIRKSSSTKERPGRK